MVKISQISIGLEEIDVAGLFGPEDALLKQLRGIHTSVEFFSRGETLVLEGEEPAVSAARKHVLKILELAGAQGKVGSDEVVLLASSFVSEPIFQARGKAIRPQTAGQRKYAEAMTANTITFGLGPAGTGKTYLAVAKAVAALKSRTVSKIILTRPAVEAGERLGYLPGTLAEKIDPYLRPLFDAVADMLDPESVNQLLATGAIEVAPLAYMRGRTLNESFVILDEAQNTTPDQMKMFLTRLGYGSQMVITGDDTQADLPGGVSGLRTAIKVLKDVPDISFNFLTSDDIVRHSLVTRIVDAYESFNKKVGK